MLYLDGNDSGRGEDFTLIEEPTTSVSANLEVNRQETNSNLWPLSRNDVKVPPRHQLITFYPSNGEKGQSEIEPSTPVISTDHPLDLSSTKACGVSPSKVVSTPTLVSFQSDSVARSIEEDFDVSLEFRSSAAVNDLM